MKRGQVIILFFLVSILPGVFGAANLEVNAFSCSPDEVEINNQFSCTATVQNTGDATGSLNTVTLYPDANNWLEDGNYPETVNTNINSGASAEVIFSGLNGKKSGDNGFSKIMLDDVTDTYVADEGVSVNVIDVVVIATNSEESAAPSSTVDITGQVTVGGNVDLVLSFSVDSGGCSIGSQPPSVTTNEMSDGQTTSHTWTVTMSTLDCVYTISAQATSNPSGTASKTDTASSTIDCSGGNCGGSGSSSSSSSGGGGSSSSSSSSGGGGAGTVVEAPEEEEPVDETPVVEEDTGGLSGITGNDVEEEIPPVVDTERLLWPVHVISSLAVLGLLSFFFIKPKVKQK